MSVNGASAKLIAFRGARKSNQSDAIYAILRGYIAKHFVPLSLYYCLALYFFTLISLCSLSSRLFFSSLLRILSIYTLHIVVKSLLPPSPPPSPPRHYGSCAIRQSLFSVNTLVSNLCDKNPNEDNNTSLSAPSPSHYTNFQSPPLETIATTAVFT